MATYGTEAYAVAQRRLSPYSEGIDDADLDDELAISSLTIRTELPTIGSYDALSGTDAEWFDVAVGTLTAMRIMSEAALSANDGLSKLKVNTFEYTFVAPSMADQAKLTAQLQQAIGFLSSVQVDRIAIAQQTSVFGIAGRNRMREEAGRMTLPKIIETLLPSGWGGDRLASAGITPGF